MSEWLSRSERDNYKLRYRTNRRSTLTQTTDKDTKQMRAILTPDDLKRGDLVPPGWYPAEIVDYEEKDAGTDKSTNCIFYFKLIDGPSKGNTVKRFFNEKALGFGKALWAALRFPFDPEKGYELTTELFKASLGQKVMIYIKRGKSDKGNEFNDVADFRPIS